MDLKLWCELLPNFIRTLADWSRGIPYLTDMTQISNTVRIVLQWQDPTRIFIVIVLTGYLEISGYCRMNRKNDNDNIVINNNIITVLLQPNTDCHHLGTNARSPLPEQGIGHKNFSLLKVRRLLLYPLQFSGGAFVCGVKVSSRLQMTSQREWSEPAVLDRKSVV